MGTEKYLADGVLRLLDELPGEVTRPPWADDPGAPFKGTPNHYALFLARNLLWSHKAEAGGQSGTLAKRARHDVEQFLDDAQKRGHYLRAQAIETLTPSHFTWHALALAGIWLCARTYRLREIEASVARWWVDQLAHESQFATSSGEIWAPGARRRRLPGIVLPKSGLTESTGEIAHHEVRDVIYQLWRGLPLKSLRTRHARWWRSRYCASAALVRRLVSEGAGLPRGGRVVSPVEIWTHELPAGGVLHYCLDWKGALDAVYAVARSADGTRTWALSQGGRSEALGGSFDEVLAMATRGLEAAEVRT